MVTGLNPDEWTPATVSTSDGVEVVFMSDYGQESRMWLSEADASKVKPMGGSGGEAVEDMAKLAELNQASMLCNLNARYSSDFIYVSFFVFFNYFHQLAVSDLHRINSNFCQSL